MSKTIEVDFHCGKARVLDFVNRLYADTIADYASQFSDCCYSDDLELANDISKIMSHLLRDYENITNDLKAIDWPSLHGIVSLIAKYPMLEHLEDSVIGAFLGEDIVISVSK